MAAGRFLTNGPSSPSCGAGLHRRRRSARGDERASPHPTRHHETLRTATLPRPAICGGRPSTIFPCSLNVGICAADLSVLANLERPDLLDDRESHPHWVRRARNPVTAGQELFWPVPSSFFEVAGQLLASGVFMVPSVLTLLGLVPVLLSASPDPASQSGRVASCS